MINTMLKKILNNRIMVFALLAIIQFSYITQPTFSKYVYTATGRAMSSLISGNVFSDSFVLTNESFVQNNADGTTTLLDEKTSKSLHGVGMEEVNGVLTVPEDADTGSFKLDSTSKMSFVVQNSSDYDLVACFDIILCMGAITGRTLSCTITAPSASEAVTEKTTLTVTAALEDTADVQIKHHKEADGSGGSETPIIDVEFFNTVPIFDTKVDYEAYSMQIDPTEFIGDQNNDGDTEDPNELTNAEFDSFILVRSGETKTFEFSVELLEGSGWFDNLLQYASKNCYASITMTVKKYERPTT